MRRSRKDKTSIGRAAFEFNIKVTFSGILVLILATVGNKKKRSCVFIIN